jgi:hypothetical protein
MLRRRFTQSHRRRHVFRPPRSALVTSWCLAILLLASLAACRAESALASSDSAIASVSRTSIPAVAYETHDDVLSKIARQAPAFGGVSFDEAGNAKVFVTDLNAIEDVSLAVRALLEGRTKDDNSSRPLKASAVPVVAVLGEFDWETSRGWRDRLREEVFKNPRVSFLDADEGRNKVTVGVETSSDISLIQRLARSLGAPDNLLNFVVEAKPVARATLSSAYSARIGGTEIGIANTTLRCTLGLIASWNWVGNRTLLTNSHCTFSSFQNQSTPISQGGNSVVFGTEVYDPGLFQGYGGCPSGQWCRMSDLAVVDISDNTAASDYGIAFTGLTNSPCTNSSCSGQITIKGKVAVTGTAHAVQGQTLNKTGRSTGWTRGTVTNTCADTPTDSLNYAPAGGFITPLFLCQIHTTIWSEGGDSGSPVCQRFTDVAGAPGEAVVYGLMWGGPPGGNYNVTWVSPVSGMGLDVGPLLYHP